MISLFSFLHTGTAFVVIVQFRGRLVRQYRACVVDSLGLGFTCVLYHCTARDREQVSNYPALSSRAGFTSPCTMCTRHPDLVSFAIPIFHIII